MVRYIGRLLFFTALAAAAPPAVSFGGPGLQQVVVQPSSNTQPTPRRLQGRFLHLTDTHPDPFYKLHSDPDEECHAGKGQAGYYGAEVTDCDSPFSLINATFKWIEDNLKDQVDFVLWTGDSARHDNDERHPRTDKQVIQLNRFLVDKFVQVFGKTDNIDDPDPTNDFVIPIVPTFGNNDILPHNILSPGPNKWTRTYSKIWNRFVPEAQRHSFARGGWFFTEVIPNRLAVISLNTLYFFDSNSAVDGCDLKSEPGYEHMEWLRIQLQFLRERGMKAIVIGHVPPARTESKQNWDESCYQKYTLWMRQYRDVIVSSFFGHMNLDHFMFQDMKELKYRFKWESVDDALTESEPSDPLSENTNNTFTIAAKAVYLNELRSGWSDLPRPPSGYSYLMPEPEVPSSGFADVFKKKKKKKKHGGKKELERFLKAIGGPWGERYSVSLVSPSVVPNFFPTMRVVEYNISGMGEHHPAVGAIGTPAEMAESANSDDLEDFTLDDLDDEPLRYQIQDADEVHPLKKKRKGKKKKKRPKKPTFPLPKPPSKSSPPGPGYSPQPLSLTSWTQYYANLTKIHEDIHGDVASKNPDKHFKYQVEYTTNNDSNYELQDLTVRSLLDLAERIGRQRLQNLDLEEDENGMGHALEDEPFEEAKKKETKTAKNHLWRVFIKRAFVHTKPDEKIDQDFG